MKLILNLDDIRYAGHAVRAAEEMTDKHPELRDMAVTHNDGTSSYLRRTPTGTIVVTTWVSS